MPTINGKACVANGRNLLTSANGEIGNIDGKNGEPIGYSFTNYYRTKDFIEVLPSTHYFIKVNSPSDTFITIEKVAWYDSDKTYISNTGYNNTSTSAITSPKNAAFFKFTVCFEDSIPAGTNVWRDNKVKFEEGTIPTALTPAPVDKVFSNGKQVYGRNLASGTGQEYVMGHGIPNTVWQDGYAYENLPTTVYGNTEILPQDPYSFQYSVTQGVTYTQTIWFETDANVKDLSAAKITWFTAGEGHDMQPATVVNLGGNKYKLYSTYTWPGNSGSHVRLFDIFYLPSAFNLSIGTYLKFGKLKLEEGKVSTPWTLAPEDVM